MGSNLGHTLLSGTLQAGLSCTLHIHASDLMLYIQQLLEKEKSGGRTLNRNVSRGTALHPSWERR
jgi:hypothetical protein